MLSLAHWPGQQQLRLHQASRTPYERAVHMTRTTCPEWTAAKLHSGGNGRARRGRSFTSTVAQATSPRPGTLTSNNGNGTGAPNQDQALVFTFPAEKQAHTSLSKPLVADLLHLLTDKQHLEQLLVTGSPLGRQPERLSQAKLQETVNKLAYHMSGYNLSQNAANAATAREEFATALSRLPRPQVPQLLTTTTTTADHPSLVPLLYYAVAGKNCTLVNLLLDNKADPNPKTCEPTATAGWQHVPVLALAVAQGDYQMVHLLLKRGARPTTIPRELYVDAVKDEGYHGLPLPNPQVDAADTAWCRAAGDRELLASALDLDQGTGLQMGYWLSRALKLPPLTATAHKVMDASKLMRVPELRMAVIGQEIACTLLYNHVMIHYGMSDKAPEERKPLVLMLAGPPGHGKTIIGQQLQSIMPDVAYHFEDCSKIHHPFQLWGASGPFKQSENLPAFARHLRTNSGKRSIVVLDEFEKMRVDVQESMFSLLQDGWSIDQYSQELIDCTQIIFLMTTNAADRQIQNYWKENGSKLLQISMQPASLHRELRLLETQIRKAVASATSVSLVSRVHGVVPFVPFTKFEQNIATHLSLVELKEGLAKPPDEKQGRIHGDLQLNLLAMTKVCRDLANQVYHESEGIRSIKGGIQQSVEHEIKTAILCEEVADVGGCLTLQDPEDCNEPYMINSCQEV